jgi:hypothetical protein
MTRGQIIPFPRLNLSDSFVERFKGICREMILDGDPIKARTFLKKFIEKITLTRNACNVAYNLAGVVPTNEDCSSLREGLVAPSVFKIELHSLRNTKFKMAL